MNTNYGGSSSSSSGTVAIDQATANANEVVVKSITAGNNNIGNVDIVTLPSGNLGAQAKAASLCVNPASDIADATYIGDIKFGEELPAGTQLIGKAGIDQTTDGTTNKVQARNATHGDFQTNSTIQIADTDVSTTNPVPVKSNAARVAATQTRPADATPYTAYDVAGTDAAANMSFANVVANAAANFVITNAMLEIDVAAVPAGMAGFRLHLYDAAPTAITDNLAFNVIAADRAKYLGYIDFDTPIDMGDTLFVSMCNVNLQGKCAAAATTIYGVLQTIGAYTPTSAAVKNVTLTFMEV